MTAASSYCSMVWHLLMFQPVHHAPAVCFLYLVMYQEKGETGQDKWDAFWFLELAAKAVTPPNPSIPVLFWFMSCSHYLFSGLSSWGPGATTRSWIFGAGQRVLTCQKHALALTRLVPLPPSLSPRMDCQSGSKTEICWNIYTPDHYEVCHVITHAHIILAPIHPREGSVLHVGAHVSRCLHATCMCATDWFCGQICVCVC